MGQPRSAAPGWSRRRCGRTCLLGYGRERPRCRIRDRNSSRWLGAGRLGDPAARLHRGRRRRRIGWTELRERGWAPHRAGRRRAGGFAPGSLRASVHHRAFTLFGLQPASWWWCGRSGRPTRSSTTMSARGASFASCSSSEPAGGAGHGRAGHSRKGGGSGCALRAASSRRGARLISPVAAMMPLDDGAVLAILVCALLIAGLVAFLKLK